jgi:hypothetical protein
MLDPFQPIARVRFDEPPSVDETEDVSPGRTLACTCGATTFLPTVCLHRDSGLPEPAKLFLCMRCGAAWRVSDEHRRFEQVTPAKSTYRPAID